MPLIIQILSIPLSFASGIYYLGLAFSPHRKVSSDTGALYVLYGGIGIMGGVILSLNTLFNWHYR